MTKPLEVSGDPTPSVYFDAIPMVTEALEAIQPSGIEVTPHYEGRGVRCLRKMIDVSMADVAKPQMELDDNQDRPKFSEHELEIAQETLVLALDDVETVFSLAYQPLRSQNLTPEARRNMLRRSGNLAVMASSLNNAELKHLVLVVQMGGDVNNEISLAACSAPFAFSGTNDQTKMLWHADIRDWIKRSEAVGCPARKHTISDETGRKQNLVGRLWQMAVDAKYGVQQSE